MRESLTSAGCRNKSNLNLVVFFFSLPPLPTEEENNMCERQKQKKPNKQTKTHINKKQILRESELVISPAATDLFFCNAIRENQGRRNKTLRVVRCAIRSSTYLICEVHSLHEKAKGRFFFDGCRERAVDERVREPPVLVGFRVRLRGDPNFEGLSDRVTLTGIAGLDTGEGRPAPEVRIDHQLRA